VAVLAGDVSDVDGSAVGAQWACALGAVKDGSGLSTVV
jgi:hypothetical protein